MTRSLVPVLDVLAYFSMSPWCYTLQQEAKWDEELSTPLSVSHSLSILSGIFQVQSEHMFVFAFKQAPCLMARCTNLVVETKENGFLSQSLETEKPRFCFSLISCVSKIWRTWQLIMLDLVELDGGNGNKDWTHHIQCTEVEVEGVEMRSVPLSKVFCWLLTGFGFDVLWHEVSTSTLDP